MKGMLARLSPHEGVALCKIGLASSDPLEPAHARRLLQLELIDWSGQGWRLILVGRQRYDSLFIDPARPSAAKGYAPGTTSAGPCGFTL